MVRAAAKNFENVTIITNKNDYAPLVKELETLNGKTSLKFRELMSSKAAGLTALYSMIASGLIQNLKFNFGKKNNIWKKITKS